MSLVGSKIGNILLEVRLGVGGMGEVYRGFDERLERSVAVKTIRADQRMSAEMKGRFLREARLLSRLGHPSICQVYDIIEGQDADFLILEFIEGDTLRELIAPGLSAAKFLDLAAQIAAALEVAHGQKVVHRDLKPENIMVTPNGRVKVLDFGIARSLRDERSSEPVGGSNVRSVVVPTQVTETFGAVPPGPLAATEIASHSVHAQALSSFATYYATQAGSVVGTRYYMSPEQATGGVLSEASDLYSFGVVLEDLLEAYRFSAQHASKVERATLGALDPDLLLLIADLKLKDPLARPDASAARMRLQAMIEKPAQRKRRQLLLKLSVAAGVILIALLGLTTFLALDARAAKALAEQRARQAESLLSFVMGDLRKKLEPIGKLELLDGIGDRALAYYAQVPDADLTATELGNLLDALRQLAVVRMKQGDYASAGRFVERALQLSRVRAAAAPTQAVWQQQLCSSLGAYGQWQGETEQPNAQTIASFQQALEACLNARKLAPTNRDILFEVAVAYGNVAVANLNGGDRALAESNFLKSNEDLSELSARQPRQVAYREQLASNFAWLSQVYESDFRADDALAARLGNLKMLEELKALEPDSALWREDESIAQHHLARLLVALGQRERALAAFKKADQLIRISLEKDSDNVWNRRAQAIIASRLARLEASQSPAPALIAAQAALYILDSLRNSDPANPDYQRISAQALIRSCEIRLLIDPRETALLTDLRSAETALAKLLARSADDAESRLWLSRAQINSARTLGANGDLDGSSAKLNEALAGLDLVPSKLKTWEADWLRANALELLKRREESLSVRVRLKARGFDPL